MHSVNLDLLRASVPHHPDGTAKDPHAHHAATHRANRRSARIVWLRKWLRFRKPLAKRVPTHP